MVAGGARNGRGVDGVARDRRAVAGGEREGRRWDGGVRDWRPAAHFVWRG